MTGPRHSPSSPWHQDTQSQVLAGVPAPAAHLSVRDVDSSVNSHVTVPERPGPNYFTIRFNEHSSGDVRQGLFPRNDWDTSHTEHAKPVFEGGQGDLNENNRRGSVRHGLPWNLELQTIESSERTVTLQSASKYGPAQNSGTISGLRPQDSMQQILSQSSRASQSRLPGAFPNSVFRHAPSVAGSHTPHNAHGAGFVSPERCAELLESFRHDVVLLDVRPFTYFAHANIQGSLNLCIPTTLLKRPSFDTRKLENTFTDDDAKKNFSKWRQCRHIIVYDATTNDFKDAAPLLNVLRKFTAEGWDGEGTMLHGGFKTFSKMFPNLVEQRQQGRQLQATESSPKPTSIHMNLPAVAPVAGGCALPEASAAMIPFFGNIRQHTDLVGGVGQIPLQLPERLTDSKRRLLPTWLRDAADSSDRGHNVSQKFLELEEKELERMKHALSYESTAGAASAKKYRIAGIEMGHRNRYNDIYPFDHTRVRLQNVPAGGCDYVNANHMKAAFSNKNYIATQAPVPDTFNDFWRVIWEQDVRLIVTLTAEFESGHLKCHPYWESGKYGSLRVNNFSQRYVYVDKVDLPEIRDSQPKRKSVGPQSGAAQQAEHASKNPCVIVRHFGVSHSAFPFQPLREVTQLQYPYWPDFGTTSQPSHLLQLIEQCDEVIRTTSNTSFSTHGAESGGQRPVLVHCSAGCGRTGTFCTVDSVLDMLKRQRSKRQGPSADKDPSNGWVYNEDLDLIAKAVSDFRTQRPSMVQNLSQFVLCYESVLEWIMVQMSEGNDTPTVH